ncbi:MAG TPA: pantetheine-phosphate adenylyltransferase [Syntrophomonadaceae bacterium]|nr:pantetheine-phosphate adenylyltransferase [Syntrophomonadaceae bacterium]
MKLAVYPGSFDPVTNGHIDILERTSKLFDKIIVGVIHNVSKQALFTPQERLDMIKQSTKHLPNIEVECFSGLLADFVSRKNYCTIIRGLRSVTDFEYEMQMAMMNRVLQPNLETIFVMSDSKYSFISSSGVKEAALLGGDVSSLVPDVVERGLLQKLSLIKKRES